MAENKVIKSENTGEENEYTTHTLIHIIINMIINCRNYFLNCLDEIYLQYATYVNYLEYAYL